MEHIAKLEKLQDAIDEGEDLLDEVEKNLRKLYKEMKKTQKVLDELSICAKEHHLDPTLKDDVFNCDNDDHCHGEHCKELCKNEDGTLKSICRVGL